MSPRHTLTWVTLVLASVAGPLIAQGDSVPRVLDEIEGPRVTLEEAVGRSLSNRPSINAGIERVKGRQGGLDQATGLFDSINFVQTTFTMRQLEFLRAQEQREIRRRLTPDIAGPLLELAARELVGGVPTQGSLLFDECESDQTVFNIIDADSDETLASLCFSAFVPGDDGLQLRGLVIPDLDPRTSTAQRMARLQRILTQVNLLNDDIEQDLEEGFADRLRSLAISLRLFSDVMAQQLAFLGCSPSAVDSQADVTRGTGTCNIPNVEQQLSFRFELGRQWRYRNGLALTSSVQLRSSENNYRGQNRDPAFGGSQIPNIFTASVGASLDIPLAKGRGRAVTAAGEQTAEIALSAERDLLGFTASSEALSAIRAYWNVAAAEERLRLISDSARVQGTLLDSVEQLIAADQVAGAEIYRSQAQYAQRLGQVASNRQALNQARIDLIDAMGESTQSIAQAPMARDGLPTSIEDDLDLGVWIERANASRLDIRASQKVTEASLVLEKASRLSMRHQFDLNLSANYNGFYQSFEDRFYDFDGFAEAVSGRIVGPSYTIGLRWRVPFKNRGARGRYLQAKASTASSQINEVNLVRQTELTLTELVQRAQVQADLIASLESNLRSLEATLETTLERYNIGEITLIDTLTTEQQLTSGRLNLVNARRDLAILYSQIQFEGGTLINSPDDAEEFDPARLELSQLN